MLKILIFFFFCFFFSKSYADLKNPNFIPLGDKEALMGNAGAGGIKSAGAVYYNPAALTEVEGSFSLTGSVYMKFKYQVSPLAIIDETDLHYKATGFVTVPSSVISVFKKNSWTFAYSILVPDAIELENKADFKTYNAFASDVTLVQLLKRSDLYIGFSAAKKIDDHLSYGVSFFGLRHYYLETSALSFILNTIPNSAISESSRMELDYYLGRALLGIQYKNSSYKLGVSLFTPTLKVMVDGDYYKQSLTNISGTMTVNTIDYKESKNINFIFPWDFTIGQVFILNPYWQISFDTSVQFEQRFDLINEPEIKKVIKLKTTPRYKLGIEHIASNSINLYAGFFYIPYTFDDFEDDLEGSAENYYGGATGIHYKSGKVSTGLGFFYLTAKGRSNLGDIERKGESRLQIMGLTLTSSYEL